MSHQEVNLGTPPHQLYENQEILYKCALSLPKENLHVMR